MDLRDDPLPLPQDWVRLRVLYWVIFGNIALDSLDSCSIVSDLVGSGFVDPDIQGQSQTSKPNFKAKLHTLDKLHQPFSTASSYR